MSEVESILNKKNIRPTAMRILVYRILSTAEAALSLTDLENDFEAADRTTLYRTMKTFENQGIVHAIEDGTGITKYALCEPFCASGDHKDLHLHFHCTICEETTCLTDYSIPKIRLPKNYIAQDMNLIVRGICDNCCSSN
ncbi:MAG TPA: transcriptional repressor [Flavobacteriaceae bacterium]|nr:transcriptional repressor [Flavobacteriaceae bacterium]